MKRCTCLCELLWRSSCRRRSTRNISAANIGDLPDDLTGKVTHGRSGVEGPAVTDDHRYILRESLPQGIEEPWLQHSQPQTALKSSRCRVCKYQRANDRCNIHVISTPFPQRSQGIGSVAAFWVSQCLWQRMRKLARFASSLYGSVGQEKRWRTSE